MKEAYPLYGLAYNCPCLQRLDDCPFKEGDHHSYSERVVWIQYLSKEEKETIREHHKVCSKNRWLIGR